VLELDADLFRKLGAADPKAVEQVGIAAAARRAELHAAREAGKPVPADAPASLINRMKQFLRLS
jgi:hypothetical protein